MSGTTSIGANGAVMVPTKRPRDTAIRQQRMKSWQPILDPYWVILAFAAIGVIFIPVGVFTDRMSSNIVELIEKYDSYDDPNLKCGITKANENKSCTIDFLVPRDMTPPVLVYYKIDNFYQNHNRYRDSRDDGQLLGAISQSTFASEDCNPLNKLGNITLNPCGLIANTLFNDVIKLKESVIFGKFESPLVLREDGIAWQSDIDFKFLQPDGFKSERCEACNDDACSCEGSDWSCEEPFEDDEGDCHLFSYPYDETTQYLHETYPMVTNPIEGVTNEHFIVWMRVAALPGFRKLYGWIDQPIMAGTVLSFEVIANWDVKSFRGSKSLIVSETSIFGGKNFFLGKLFFYVGVICISLAILFGLKHKLRPRKLADKAYLRYKSD